MHQIQLTDQVYHRVKHRADEAGFSSVDDYIADELGYDDEYEDTPHLDHFFTTERITELDRISADVKAGGQTYTMEEVSEHLAQHRAAWIRENLR